LSKGKDTDIALNYVETLLANNNRVEAQRILSEITVVSAEQIEKKRKLSE
jgi:hypothetical protein